MSENWESEELEASVKSYADMRSKEMAGEKFTKASYYKSLSERFGRSPKAYEYRMQNISHIYHQQGRQWLTGLKPLSNVGKNISDELESLITLHDPHDSKNVDVDHDHTSKKKRSSWMVVDKNRVSKMLDSSVFSDNGSGIPKDFLYFFELHDVEKKVTLETYVGRFDAELKLSNGRWRLMWRSGFTDFLKSKFPDWENIEPFKPIQSSRIIFARTIEQNTYAIDIQKGSYASAVGRNEISKPPKELSINDASHRSNVRHEYEKEIQVEEKEKKLVYRYKQYLENFEHLTFQKWSIKDSEGTPLETDGWIAETKTLIEAKASNSREDIRMAIGQLLDYRRFDPVPTDVAVLLPERPSSDLISLLLGLEINIIYETEGRFEKISVNSDTSVHPNH